MEKILERSFDLLSADRGVILLFEDGDKPPRATPPTPRSSWCRARWWARW